MKTYNVETFGIIRDTFKVLAPSEEDAMNEVIKSLGLDEEQLTCGMSFCVSDY